MKKNQSNPKSNRKQFGNYIIGKTLGEGTFGKVKLGTHKITGENVAIKILEKDKINDIADTERVLRQIHILKLIRHPYVVQLYEIIETPKKLFLIMEFMEKGQLFDYIVKQKRIKEDEACKLFHQLLDGIEHIHKIGIVHRDLKPQNLLLDYKRNLRIVDFGLSNTYKKNDLLKTPCGSPCYAAPEMLKGESYDPLKVDIWSSGVILFAMLCGYLPFEDNQNTSDLYAKILKGQYKIHRSVSESGCDLLSKIMCVDPNHRYTIEDIRKHPWMVMTQRNRNISKGIVIGYNKIPIDNNILNILKDYGLDTDYGSKCLEANRHNNITTTYYLAMKKFIKEGGKTCYDLSSKEFDKGLLQPNKRRYEYFFQKTDEDTKSKEKNALLEIKNSINVKMSERKSKSKVKKVDSRIQNSINYGRPSISGKSKEKEKEKVEPKRRQSQLENRLSRKYKQKFNQSLISKSKDKIGNRSRINSSIHKKKQNETVQINEITNIMEQFEYNHKRTVSKKSCGQSIRSDTTKILKARKL